MLTAKRVGADVVVLVSYDGRWVYRYDGVDCERALEGKSPRDILKAVLDDVETNKPAEV